jgi:hypothetical protein
VTQQRFLNNQVLELERLLEDSANNPVLRLQLEARLEEARAAIGSSVVDEDHQGSPDQLSSVRAAIFLRGGGVDGSFGIRPSLAGEALLQYEKMYVEQATFEERSAARATGRTRRPRGASTPRLLFCGTPRGSFGLEFAPQAQSDPALSMIHNETLTKVADSVIRIVEDGDATLPDLPPRMLHPLKQFLKVLAQHGAELRFAFSSQPSRAIGIESIRQASERLEREIQEETISVRGTFRGITLESGIFDIMTESGLISGTVADSLSEEDLERIVRLTNRSCIASVLQTTVITVVGSPTQSHVLLDATAATSGA